MRLGSGPRPAFLLLALLLLLGACAPRLAPPGPGLDAARGEAFAAAGIAGDKLITGDGLALPLRHWPALGKVGAGKTRDGVQTVSENQTAPGAAAPAEAGPRAVILALHGFNDYGKAFDAPAAFWAGQGIATYAYDQRGFGAAPHHGLWPGEEAMIADLRTAAHAIQARHPGVPLFLLGESMGGAVILAALAQPEPLPGTGVILAAPAVWARTTMPWYQRWTLWFFAHTLPWAKPSGRGLAIQASDNIEMLRALGRDPLVIKNTRIDAIYGLVNLMDRALSAAPAVRRPALILYGEKDEVVPRDPTFRLWRGLPAAARDRTRPALYGEGWHMLLRDLKAAVVLADVAAWIAAPGNALPSGADRRAAEALAREMAP